MGSKIYQSYKRTDAELQESGYQKFYLNILDDFTTLSEPDTNAATGDCKIINDAHVWAAGKGPMVFYINNKSLEAPADTVGDQGSLRFKHTLKVFWKGDGPVPQDLAESILNEDLIGFTTDGCPDPEILQYGCDCIPGQVSKGGFTSGTLAGGSKGWSFEIEFYCRYFYRGGDITPRT